MNNINEVEIIITLESGEMCSIKTTPGEEVDVCMHNIKLSVDGSLMPNIKCNTVEKNKKIESIAYRFTLAMRNYSKVIVPDSGRWYLRYSSLIDFWRSCREFSSNISDIKIPLFIFLNNSGNAESAVGVIGINRETKFSIIEPESNRALNVHTGHIVLEIKKGSKNYPLHKNIFNEKLYLYSANGSKGIPWVLIQREFTNLQRKEFNLVDTMNENAFEPIWCSWVDWDSKDINTKMLLENMKIGISLGIKNFIIDDGWYGNGLDSNYSTEMNIGDWKPDPKKISDMAELVDKAHKVGAKLIIWCAPHAVAKKSNSFEKNYKLLLSDKLGNPIINAPQYYSYCFCCEKSRKKMADICVMLQEKWGFDGAKYDLFNWIPDYNCESPYHKHDINSAIEGLELMLEDVYKRTSKNNPSHIIELKQNYGTAFITQYGHLMRAGDSPFDGETNFQRTLHIQSYTNNALNDYQTFTKYDSIEDIAISIIKMIAVGIPAYGINFSKLDNKTMSVFKNYNEYFHNHKKTFKNERVPLDSDCQIIKVIGEEEVIIFRLAENRVITIDNKVTIINGSYSKELVINNKNKNKFIAKIYDCIGNYMGYKIINSKISCILVPVGGLIVLEDNGIL